MAKNSFFDYGHGGEDSGAVLKRKNKAGKLVVVRKEKDDVLKIGRAVAKRIRDHKIKIKESRTSDKTMSLTARTNIERAGAYDISISFHRDSVPNESANGMGTYIQQGQRGKDAERLARAVHSKVIEASGFTDRGIREEDFHMTRETISPAILMELGFISNEGDNEKFDANFNKIVEAIVEGICEYLKVKYVAPIKYETKYYIKSAELVKLLGKKDDIRLDFIHDITGNLYFDKYGKFRSGYLTKAQCEKFIKLYPEMKFYMKSKKVKK